MKLNQHPEDDTNNNFNFELIILWPKIAAMEEGC